MSKQFSIHLPQYTFDQNLVLETISKKIDDILLDNFKSKKIVIRGIQSKKHKLSKEQLVRQILSSGTDRYEVTSENKATVNDKQIDLFGYACSVINPPVVLPILEGFHKWKPKSLERPQRRVDIWMVYDADKLKNVEYTHGHYGVKAKDGYVFKNPNKKNEALLGLLVIQ